MTHHGWDAGTTTGTGHPATFWRRTGLPRRAPRSRAGWTPLVIVLVAAAGALGAAFQAPGNTSSVRLRDVADSAGLYFVHQPSWSTEKHYVESTPGGLAVFDYNGD